MTRNAARLAKPVAHQHREVEPLSVEEARALLKQVSDHRLGSLFTVALSLGLRQGECVGLRWEDVDLEAARLTVVRQITRTNEHVETEGDPKTRRSRRSLLLPHVCVDQLERHREQQEIEHRETPPWDDRGLVWLSEAGTALTPSNLRRLLRRQCELAGVRQVTFHTLRHSAASPRGSRPLSSSTCSGTKIYGCCAGTNTSPTPSGRTQPTPSTAVFRDNCRCRGS